ncbi:MAG: Enoyl-CoA hydratase/isomerase [Bradyrhizobium sp.]|nr:Enoyl-CoA hydratase/isomerase [Bradyrhizobium sp.]
MNAEILDTKIVDGIAVVTLGSPKRLYFDAEMGDALTGALETSAGDHSVRVVIVTGGAPGYFDRHFDIPSLIRIAEDLRASGREWPENATYNSGFFDKAMALCETMPKPVIAAISGTAIAGAFHSRLRFARCGGWRLPFGLAGGEPRIASRRRRHSEIAPHDRNVSRADAHLDGRCAVPA